MTKKCILPPLTFTPNVPIPNLFGTTEVSGELFAKYLGAFYVYFIGVIGILAVVMIMYGGYHYIVSMGNPSRMKQGKEIISGALIGLMLALTSFLLLNIINPALVNIRGIVPTFIGEILQTYEKNADTKLCSGKAVNAISSKDYETIAGRVEKGKIQDIVKNVAVRGDVNLPPEYIMGNIFLESAGQNVISKPDSNDNKPAYGLMQIKEATAMSVAKIPADRLLNPEDNVYAGAKYLRQLLDNTCPHVTQETKCTIGSPCKNGDWKYVYAAYGGGLGINACSKNCEGSTIWECEKNSCSAVLRSSVPGKLAAAAYAKTRWYGGN